MKAALAAGLVARRDRGASSASPPEAAGRGEGPRRGPGAPGPSGPRARPWTTSYFSRIAQARLEWRLNNVSGARQLLDRCDPRRRGWEWHYLDNLDHSELLDLDVPPAMTFVIAVAFSPDGQPLRLLRPSTLTASPEAAERASRRGLGDATRTRLAAFAASGPTARLSFSPDGRRLVASGAGRGQALGPGDREDRPHLARDRHPDLQPGRQDPRLLPGPSRDLLGSATGATGCAIRLGQRTGHLSPGRPGRGRERTRRRRAARCDDRPRAERLPHGPGDPQQTPDAASSARKAPSWPSAPTGDCWPSRPIRPGSGMRRPACSATSSAATTGPCRASPSAPTAGASRRPASTRPSASGTPRPASSESHPPRALRLGRLPRLPSRRMVPALRAAATAPRSSCGT